MSWGDRARQHRTSLGRGAGVTGEVFSYKASGETRGQPAHTPGRTTQTGNPPEVSERLRELAAPLPSAPVLATLVPFPALTSPWQAPGCAPVVSAQRGCPNGTGDGCAEPEESQDP